MKRDVLNDAVALVEQAEDRDPLAHRRHARLIDAGRSRGIGNHRPRVILFIAAAPASGDGERERDNRCGSQAHAYSGIQGS
jgi:hypothetical protein